jgi:predicted TIM-barrel fold metal-dependent hydrolase
MPGGGGAWDCHAHVIGDSLRYPLAPWRVYEPSPAPLEAYLEMLDRHGLARGVLVQPSVYGFDNRCMLDALDRADGRLSGVAVPAPTATPEELEAMHRRGVRGIRCNLVNPGGLDPGALTAWRPVLRSLGWHVELHLEVQKIADLRAYIGRFDVPVVIDHMGRPKPGSANSGDTGLSQLVSLVRDGSCFVKLSAPYRLSSAPPPWRDVTPLARTLLAANPRACLWATDWPHTQAAAAVSPDDLIEALDEWCPEPGVKRIMLVDAPAALFGSALTP